MKTIDLLILITLLVCGLTSCNKEEKLATEIEGCWIGSTVNEASSRHHRANRFGLAPDITLTCDPVLTFIKNENICGGDFSLSAEFRFSFPDVIHTVIPAYVIAKGSWTTLDNDEVLVSLNPRSVTINMDPAVQSIPYSTITGTPRNQLNSATVNELHNQHPLYLVIERIVKSFHKIKHIKIADQKMSVEINDNDLTFTRKTSD